MLKKPNTMEEVIYYTTRDIDNGEATVWVFKGTCEKCGKGVMEKPRDEKGKIKIRAKEYVCSVCGNTVEKKACEESLIADVEYVCPECNNKGEMQVPFKRKKIDGAETLRVKCQKCSANIDITKKFKEKKNKCKPDPEEMDEGDDLS